MNESATQYPSNEEPRAIKRPPEFNPKTYEPGSLCFCRQCQTSSPHQKGKPCEAITCPHCGAPMTRKF
ncbi:hypothetical protein [Desulfoplanes sp.]